MSPFDYVGLQSVSGHDDWLAQRERSAHSCRSGVDVLLHCEIPIADLHRANEQVSLEGRLDFPVRKGCSGSRRVVAEDRSSHG